METRTRFAALSLASLTVALGCNALDDEQESPIGKSVKIVPTDTRPVSQPEVAPPPISGGTMLSFGDNIAIADPARDRVSLMKMGGEGVQHIELAHGAEPFRMAQGADGHLYVVLRGSGEVARIDVVSATLKNRFNVCAAPRGIAYDPSNDELVVACAEGKLVNLVPGTLEFKSEVPLEPDLRDIVVKGDRRYVSRFRSAEILFVEGTEIRQRVKPAEVHQRSRNGNPDATRTLRPAVAWRMVSDPRGGVIFSHQRAVMDSIGVDPHAEETAAGEETSFDSSANASPYGGSGDEFSCDGIVHSSVTAVDVNGGTTSSMALGGMVLPVDLSISPDGQSIAVANAGARDQEAPRPRVEFVSAPGELVTTKFAAPAFASANFGSGSALLLDRGSLFQITEEFQDSGCNFGTAVGGTEPSTSVAFTRDNKIVIQEESSALLHQVDRLTFESLVRPLGGRDIVHTGHEIFHRDAGGGLACASCHPEGGDDGNVWTFTGIGPRRTQSLAVPLRDTAPFHWDGSLKNLDSLMGEVFVERMGGVFESKERLASLEDWMFTRVVPEMPEGDRDIVARGKALFHSAEVGCGSCHSGSAFTDNNSYNVGTTPKQEPLQVPPLNGLLLRPPYMHNGCAKTLHERFSAECGGGDNHGRTSQLSAIEIDELVAYMRTL